MSTEVKMPEGLYYDMIISIQKPNPTRLVTYRLVLKNKNTDNVVCYYSSSYLSIDDNGKIVQFFGWLLDKSHKEERRQLAKHGITFHKSWFPFYRKVYRIGRILAKNNCTHRK